MPPTPENQQPEKKPEEKKPTPPKPQERHVPTNFPLPPAKLKREDQERVKVWASQEKRGLITLCNAQNGKEHCYYPLTPVRDEASSNSMTPTEDSRGRKGWKGRCSFDPLDHGEQVILPPKKDDEL